jgi:hypothetical protein
LGVEHVACSIGLGKDVKVRLDGGSLRRGGDVMGTDFDGNKWRQLSSQWSS